MDEYIAQCRHDGDQRIKAHTNGVSVVLVGYSEEGSVTEPYLSAASARTFARGILALADEVDGGEEKAGPATDNRPKVGDRVIVIEDDPDDRTGEFVNLVGTLTDIIGGPYTPYLVKFGEGSHGDVDGQWYCQRVEKVADEPDSPSAATITRPTREAYLHRAAELLGADPSALDLIELADYLAGEDA
ncbi:hypothetical protein OG554_03440 [Streptomyces griseus]|uniref:hypothetical protein n=1 Tax=Streptomyces griseus TaxID=1911 RepID=UPI00386EFB46|nr:hypothetical protein OG554_03440 [Streptomyces fimicarius]